MGHVHASRDELAAAYKGRRHLQPDFIAGVLRRVPSKATDEVSPVPAPHVAVAATRPPLRPWWKGVHPMSAGLSSTIAMPSSAVGPPSPGPAASCASQHLLPARARSPAPPAALPGPLPVSGVSPIVAPGCCLSTCGAGFPPRRSVTPQPGCTHLPVVLSSQRAGIAKVVLGVAAAAGRPARGRL